MRWGNDLERALKICMGYYYEGGRRGGLESEIRKREYWVQPWPQYYFSSILECCYQQADDRSLSVSIARLGCLEWAIGTGNQVPELEIT